MEGKQVKKVVAVIIVILLLIVAIFAVLTIRKVSIFNSLLANAKETEKITNYYMKQESTQGSGITTEVWSKDETHYFIETKTGDNTTIRIYQNGEEKIKTTDALGQKHVTKGSAGRIELYTFSNFVNTNSVWKDATKASISSIKLDDKECYEIKLADNKTIIVEKETGLVQKIPLSECSYELNTVTDANIQKPDLTGYEEVN